MFFTTHFLNALYTAYTQRDTSKFRDTRAYKLVLEVTPSCSILPLKQTKEVLNANGFGYRTLMAYRTGDGKQADNREVRTLGEKSSLLSLGAHKQAGLLRRGHQRGVQVTPLRGSFRAKTRPVPGPGSQQRRVPVGG